MLLQALNLLNDSPLLFPALECAHIIRIALSIDAAPRIPARAKLAASLSLILWTSLLIIGRGIGYIEPPLDKIHARFFAPEIALAAFPADRRL